MPTIDPTKKQIILQAAALIKLLLQHNAEAENLPLKDLLDLIRSNVQVSWNQIEAHYPTTDCHHQWMHYAHLLTTVYNQMMNEQVYSVLSRVLQSIPISLVTFSC